MHPTRAEATKEVAPPHVGFFLGCIFDAWCDDRFSLAILRNANPGLSTQTSAT